MVTMRFLWPLAGIFIGALMFSLTTFAVQPQGIVYESEAIASPDSAWVLNERAPDKWMLWTKEEDIDKKRSGGAVLASPAVSEDRAAPDEGAPMLHCVVDDLEPGTYIVYLSNPGARPLAYSLNMGDEWVKYQGSEANLGIWEWTNGRFEFWIDDRFAHPANNPGPGYFDYVRFVPVAASAAHLTRFEYWRGLDLQVTKEGRGFVAGIEDFTALEGFEIAGAELRGGDKTGHSFNYTLDRDGTYYLALHMNDDEDGIKQLTIALNSEEIGCIVGAGPHGQFVASSNMSVSLKKGDKLTFTATTPVGYYRVYGLYFSQDPIEPPPPGFQHLVAWSPEAGRADLCWITTTIVDTGVVEYGPGDFETRTEPIEYKGRNHRAKLAGLDPSKEYQARIRTEHLGKPLFSEVIRFRSAPPMAAATKELTVPLRIAEPTSEARGDWPVTGGVPFPEGTVGDVGQLRLFDPSGRPVPLQADEFSRWPDGTLKWAVLSFLASTQSHSEPVQYQLKARASWDVPPPEIEPAILNETAEAWTLTNGLVELVVPKKSPAASWTIAVDLDGDGAISPAEREASANAGLRLAVTTPEHGVLVCGPPDTEGPTAQSDGPVRVLLQWTGPLVTEDGADSGWRYLMQAGLSAKSRGLALDVAVYDASAQPDFRELSSVELVMTPPGGPFVQSAFDGAPLTPLPQEGIWLKQLHERVFTLSNSSGEKSGEHAQGFVSARNDHIAMDAFVPDFWQTYPKAISVEPEAIWLHLLPELSADVYSGPEYDADYYKLFAWFKEGKYIFRAGQMCRHSVLLRFGGPNMEAADAQTRLTWAARPLLPIPPTEYLCNSGIFGRPLFPRTPGVWDEYESMFDGSFEASLANRDAERTYGWMHFGDWYGERYCNYGNSEYDMAWALGLQWARTGRRDLYDRGLEMARHYSTVDTRHGPFTEHERCVVWEHCFNHVGTSLSVEELRVPEDDEHMKRYLSSFGRMIRGAMDPQGHVFNQGSWLYAALTGDPFHRYVAEHIANTQARALTPSFNFSIERSGGWPIINAVTAYNFSGNPYYLNAARLMVERCFEREDPVKGGWPHYPPINETGGERVLGGKAFAVGILTHGLLRYLEQEPEERQDVRDMLVRAADWLMNESWIPGKGFRYITNAPNHQNVGRRGITCALDAEIIAFAYEETGDSKYLEFWKDMMQGVFDDKNHGMGKAFTQMTRQTIYGLDRLYRADIEKMPK